MSTFTARDLMEPLRVTAGKGEPAASAARRMRRHGATAAPVIAAGRVSGIMTLARADDAVRHTSLAGTVLLYLAVRGRNATLASLIEISYPAFVAIFAWIMFREWQLNAGVLLGALLVFAGTAIIILNSR